MQKCEKICNFAKKIIQLNNCNYKNMKKILLSAITLMLLGSLSAQNVARECVLFEVFTGVNCQYCPAAANAIVQMLDEGLAIAPVAVHTSAFSTPEFYTSETNARANFYGITSYPTLKADGKLTVSGGGHASENMYEYYLPHYNSRINTPSPFTIDLSYSYVEGSMCQVTAVVNQVGECTASNLKIMIALTESHIQKNWQGMTELNAVTRDFIPTQTGTAFEGPTTTVTETFDMAGYPKENMHLVAWIQSFSAPKEVYQAVRLSLEPEATNYDVALRKLNYVVTKNCSGKIHPTLVVKTFGTQTVTSMDIEVTDESNNVITTYNWTGNETQGSAFDVDLPEFDIQGANTVVFNIKKINNNDDAYPFDNYMSVKLEEAETHPGDLYVQVKTASDPEQFYLELKNMDTNEIIYDEHFDQGSHVYKFYISIPKPGCYRLSVLSPSGTGCGNGYAKIQDGNGSVLMQFSQSGNVFKDRYSIEFANDITDVDEVISNNVIAYPNPASNVIYIKEDNISDVLIYNALGQVMYSKSIECDNLTIDTSSFEEGLYVVKVRKTNGETVSQKIVVKK